MRRLFFILLVLLIALMCQAQHNHGRPTPPNPQSLGDGRLLIYKNCNVKIPCGNLTVDKNIYCDTLISTSVKLTNGLFYMPSHNEAAYKDSAVVITGGTNVQVTNIYDSLYGVTESIGLTYLKGDTFVIDKYGGYFIFISISGYGTNAVDWRLTFAYKRGATIYNEYNSVEFTTTGATNKDGRDLNTYHEFQVGDKVWVTLTRTSGSGNFTTTTGNFQIANYYLK